MHFSSATPTGEILARSARRAKTVGATSAAYSPAPLIPLPRPRTYTGPREGVNPEPLGKGPRVRSWRALAFLTPDPEKAAVHPPGQSGPRCLSKTCNLHSRPPKIMHSSQALVSFSLSRYQEKSFLPPSRKRLSLQSESSCHSVNLPLPMTPASRNQVWSRPADCLVNRFPPWPKCIWAHKSAPRLAKRRPNLRLRVPQVHP